MEWTKGTVDLELKEELFRSDMSKCKDCKAPVPCLYQCEKYKQSICMECESCKTEYNIDGTEASCIDTPGIYLEIWENGGDISKYPIYSCPNYRLKPVSPM